MFILSKMQRRLLSLFFLVLLALVPYVTAAKAEPAKAAEESWVAIYIGNDRVGYGRDVQQTVRRGEKDVVTTENEQYMAISRLGQSVKVRTILRTEETSAGDLLEFQFELQNPPAATTRTTGRIEKEKLLLETEVEGKITKREIAWDRSIKSPGYESRLLRDNPMKPGEKRIMKTFSPEFARPNTVTLQAGKRESVKLLKGKSAELLKVDVSMSIAPLIATQVFLDDKGAALVSKVNLLGMTTYDVPKEEALAALTGAEVDLAINTLVRVPKIERPRATKRVVYRVSVPGEDPSKLIPAGPTQELKRIDVSTVELTVRSVLPGSDPAAPRAAPADKKFLATNEIIQSDDARVMAHAKAAVGSETDPWKAAKLMERWVYSNLKQKNFSTLLASAAEVAKDLSGDCTEHAVLLAAMCRASKIPARVAVGLVYVDSYVSMGGHMWTEVLIDGQWIPLDATLGQGGIAAEHIKFSDSSFSNDEEIAPLSTFLPLISVLGKMKIELIAIEH
jgi:Transglutaminase-like superfamily